MAAADDRNGEFRRVIDAAASAEVNLGVLDRELGSRAIDETQRPSSTRSTLDRPRGDARHPALVV
jgi:hypothetical protein